MFFKFFENVIKIYIHSVFMCYMFRPHRAIFRQHTFLMNPLHCALCPIVLLKYVVIIIIIIIIIIINWCYKMFVLSFVLRPLCAPLGVLLPWLCVLCVDLCSLYIVPVALYGILNWSPVLGKEDRPTVPEIKGDEVAGE
jgi:hypothetical protein